jgi:hypothetical protein
MLYLFGMALLKKWNVCWLDGKSFILSKRGRLTLIKGTLSNLPTYHWSLYLFQWVWQIGLRNLREIFYGVELGMSLNSI